jgi:hypothetical protein
VPTKLESSLTHPEALTSRSVSACWRSVRRSASGAVLLIATLTGCEDKMDSLCAVNMRAAERALAKADASLARSHFEVARRACPRADLRVLGRQIDKVDRVSAGGTSSSPGGADALIAARALEAQRLGSIVLWAARTWKHDLSAVTHANCAKARKAGAVWCDGATQQGVSVRTLQDRPEVFRLVANFPASVALDCSLFGTTIEDGHWTDSSGGSPVEHSRCRITRGPFDGLELLVDTRAKVNTFSLSSPQFARSDDG